MHREPVESDALRSVGYDFDQGVLEIEFATGLVYQYFGIPEHVYLDLMTASSHGEFFTQCIRNAGYDYEQVG